MTIADVARPAAPPTRRQPARAGFPARPPADGWPAARLSRSEILCLLACPPFALATVSGQRRRIRGAGLLLDWLEDQAGQTWQQRWLASGADAAGMAWRQETDRWMRERGEYTQCAHLVMSAALPTLICADIVRPSLAWFVAGAASHGQFLRRCP